MADDGYVRVPTSELPTIQLRHLMSEKDLSITGPDGFAATVITGITEWVGSWRNETISVGWDWGVVDGVVVMLTHNEIRTNIQLISESRRPESPTIGKIHLFHWIETLPWREVAINDLLTDDHCLR